MLISVSAQFKSFGPSFWRLWLCNFQFGIFLSDVQGHANQNNNILLNELYYDLNWMKMEMKSQFCLLSQSMKIVVLCQETAGNSPNTTLANEIPSGSLLARSFQACTSDTFHVCNALLNICCSGMLHLGIFL